MAGKAVGVEPSKWASKIGKEKYGLNIVQGTLETDQFKNKSFDVVTCLDVMSTSHLPKKLLYGIHRF